MFYQINLIKTFKKLNKKTLIKLRGKAYLYAPWLRECTQLHLCTGASALCKLLVKPHRIQTSLHSTKTHMQQQPLIGTSFPRGGPGCNARRRLIQLRTGRSQSHSKVCKTEELVSASFPWLRTLVQCCSSVSEEVVHKTQGDIQTLARIWGATGGITGSPKWQKTSLRNPTEMDGNVQQWTNNRNGQQWANNRYGQQWTSK